MNIAFHNRIELKNLEAKFFAFLKAILNKLLSDMLPPCIRGYSITGIADMSTSADIVWVKDVQTVGPLNLFSLFISNNDLW